MRLRWIFLMFSLGDELCGGFFYEVAFFNLVLSVRFWREPKVCPEEVPGTPGKAWEGLEEL